MKKNLFMVAAVALLAFAACNKEEFNYGAGAPVGSIEFTAGFEAETKTTLADGKTAWIEGDEISINGVKFRAKQSGLTSTFENAEVPQGEFKAPFTAIYPYSETAGIAKVSETQTVSSGTFADDVVVSVAYAEDGNNLCFRHVSSVVKFQVATEGIKELVFSSSAADLAGTINVIPDAENPSYEVESGVKTITVKPAEGTFKSGENDFYYVSVLPTLGEEKVDFRIETEGVTVKSGNVKFVRNTIADAKSIEVKYVEFAAGTWASTASAAIGAYFFKGDRNEWVKMIPVADYKYKCVVPEGYSNVIFCRLDPQKELGWDSKWNQTADLTLPSDGKNRFVVDATGEWEGAKGEWTEPAKQIYFNPGAWTADGAWFAAYFFGSGEKWDKFTDKNKDGIYECSRPEKYTSIIFCRMASDKTTLGWGSKWNQSADITLPSNGDNHFTINTNGSWDGAKGTWKKW